LHDALSRSARQAERILASVGATLRDWGVQPAGWDGDAVGADVASASASGTRPWLRRWFGRAPVVSPLVPEAVAEMLRVRETAAHLADRLDGLAAGVLLNVQRLERALTAYGIEPIACLGQPVDSEAMEVVQIVTDPTHPSGVVIDEVRRGYRRHGRVYRAAQVVATRSTPQTASAPLPAAAPDGPGAAHG
jgi:hypothetical protein